MEIPSRVIGQVDKYQVVDLFPYKIKNLKKFIHRNHVPYKEGDQECRDYAKEVWRRCTDGYWVDDEGTAVFMMPKLYFFANLATVMVGEGKTRRAQYPDVTVIEWCIFSYILCCDGFSGFEGDDKYTCNVHIDALNKGEELPIGTLNSLKVNCQKADGSWKEYINAWDYLTYAYLIGDPRGPLGKPLYENNSYNGMIMATRGGHKSYCLSAGDCAHEMWTDGAMYYEDLKSKLKTVMFMGSSDTEFMRTFVDILKLSLENIPGIEHERNPLLTKTYTGDWSPDRGGIKHHYRKSDGSYGGSESELSKAVIPINKPQVVVSKRAKRIYVDECGLQGNLIKVHEASDTTLKDDHGKFGVEFDSGTGGAVDKILENQTIYYDPVRFDIYPVPNYWFKNELIALFIPASMKQAAFRDENGNIPDLIGATKRVIAERNKMSGGDITKQTGKRQNEPLEPTEIFLSDKINIFDTDTIIDRIDVLRKGVWEKKAKVYHLELGKFLGEVYDVIATPVEGEFNHVHTDYLSKEKKVGRVVVYEPPMGDGREFLPFNNLYKATLDPKTDLETGESYYAGVVWKGLPHRQLQEGEMFNNIVAEFKLTEEGLLQFMLLCLWYKCRGQFERNVSGIPDFFDKYGMRGLLQPTPLAYIKDVVPGTKQIQQVGIVMNEQLKREGLKLLRKLHKLMVHEDPNGRRFKMVETWYTWGLLSEMNYYNEEGNFDLISAMIILALWLESEHIPSESARQQEDLEDDGSWDELAQIASRILG